MTHTEALRMALEALAESIDLVRNDYATDWRHGISTRKAQLDAMAENVKAHEAAIEACRAALAAQQAAPSDGAIYAAVSERASPEWHAGFRAGLSAGQACAAAHARQPAQAPTTDTGEQR